MKNDERVKNGPKHEEELRMRNNEANKNCVKTKRLTKIERNETENEDERMNRDEDDIGMTKSNTKKTMYTTQDDK